VIFDLIQELGNGDRLSKTFLGNVNRLGAIATHLYVLALARSEWADGYGNMYLDRPNVVSLHSGISFEPHGEVALFRAFDIIANEVAVNPASAANPFFIRIKQGVLDTNAEALLITKGCRAPSGRTICVGQNNTADLFANSRRQGVNWTVVNSSNDFRSLPPNLSEDISTRIKRDLDGRYIVLVPPTPVSVYGHPVFSWWQIDAEIGNTIGIGANGWGTAGTEKSLLDKFVTGSVIGLVIYPACLIAKEIFGKLPQDERGVMREAASCAILGMTGGPGLFVPFPANVPLLIIAFAGEVGI
jgi:hypothetical protein